MIVACVAASTQASVLYDFQQAGTATVLATLELSSVPANETHIAGLTFTPAGDAIFGFGSTYSGTFDTSNGAFADDGVGGLQGGIDYGGIFAATMTDNDPPASTVFPGPFAFSPILDLYADSRPDEDVIHMYPNGPGSPLAYVSGNWRQVPEPATLGFLIIGGMALLRRKRVG